MESAQQIVNAFHTHHRDRTFDAGHPSIDPWMRDVLVSLQNTLQLLAQQIDDNTKAIRRLGG